VSVTNGRDDLWVGVKCQANLEIAGSPRNALRCSLGAPATEVACRIGKGACRLPTRTKRRMPSSQAPGSETVGAKFHRQKGNSPDRRLRSPSPD
jgi:hypothetical protein